MKYLVLLAFVAMICFYLYYQHFKHRAGSGRVKRIAVKCAATLMAAAVALLGAIDSGLPAHWAVFAGLLVCAVADGVLCVHFMLGAATFAIGHVVYIIAFSMMHLPSWGSMAVLACMLAGITLLVERWKKRMGRRAPLFLAYGVMLCMMTAVSAAQTPLFFAGGLLFAISDALLAYQLFDRRDMRIDYMSLGCYYLGQFLLGLGVFGA